MHAQHRKYENRRFHHDPIILPHCSNLQPWSDLILICQTIYRLRLQIGQIGSTGRGRRPARESPLLCLKPPHCPLYAQQCEAARRIWRKFELYTCPKGLVPKSIFSGVSRHAKYHCIEKMNCRCERVEVVKKVNASEIDEMCVGVKSKSVFPVLSSFENKVYSPSQRRAAKAVAKVRTFCAEGLASLPKLELYVFTAMMALAKT